MILRHATADDVPALVEVLARAFDDDPWVTWLVRKDAGRPRGVRHLFRMCLVDLALPHEEVWTDAGRTGTALWVPPGKWKVTAWDQLRMLPDAARISGWRRLGEIGRSTAHIARSHPTAPHWYLLELGVEPLAQGQGLGKALVRPILERCDSSRTGAYLETAKESNVAFYRRLGFAVLGEHRIQDGPTVWTMWRAPSAGGT